MSTLSREALEQENAELRAALRFFPDAFKKLNISRAKEALQHTVIFNGAEEADLNFLADRMERVDFKRGHLIVREGSEMTDAYIIYSGDVRRFVTESGKLFVVSTFCPRSIGLLHFYNRSRDSRFNAECLTDVVAFRLKRKDMDQALELRPNLAKSMIRDLSFYIRTNTRHTSTPLFEQRSYNISIVATSLAAMCESFYRSAMNNLINYRINGTLGTWFPRMEVQIPARMIYINGLKQIRTQLDNVDLSGNPYQHIYRLLFTFAPGVIMCPFSSLLEAANAPNPEPLSIRWTRGYFPRIGREVIFGIGMNQLADFFTERLHGVFENPYARGAGGSIAAGLCAGYLSHMPHILSTRKLASPHLSYKAIYESVWQRSLPLVPEFIPAEARPTFAKAMSFLLPIGCAYRSAQLCGTFIIINGITYSLRDKDWL
jgi:CRP-like cAMP-binding protein